MTTVPSFTCFSMFVYIQAHFCFAPIGGNLTAQPTRSHWRIGGKIQIPKMLLQADCIFIKRKNLRFTGEKEEYASLHGKHDPQTGAFSQSCRHSHQA